MDKNRNPFRNVAVFIIAATILVVALNRLRFSAAPIRGAALG